MLAQNEMRTDVQAALERVRRIRSVVMDHSCPERGRSQVSVNSARPATQEPDAVALMRDEIDRLNRLVHLMTVTIGELNLWLANIGREVDEVKA